MANKITKNIIVYSKSYKGNIGLVKAVNFKPVEIDTTNSKFIGLLMYDKVKSDECVHITHEFERYLELKSSAILPMNTDLSYGDIKKAKEFYEEDSYFVGKLSKEERENIIKQYDEIKKQKQLPAIERKRKKEADKKKAEREFRKQHFYDPVYEYDYESDILKNGSISATTF